MESLDIGLGAALVLAGVVVAQADTLSQKLRGIERPYTVLGVRGVSSEIETIENN